MKDPNQKNLKWLLLRTTIPIKHIVHKMAEKHGLTMMQLWTLSLIEPGEEKPMNTISQTLACDASNLTGIVDRLLSMDLIERCECQKDRRIKNISLTHKGEKLRVQLLQELNETPIDNLSRLTTKEQEILCELLFKTLAPPKN